MRRPRVFYGWWVTLAFAVMVFLSTGVRFTVGPFLKPIVADLGIDRAAFSLVVSLSLFLYGVFMPFVGRHEVTGGYGAAFTVASVQLVAAAIVSLAIDERIRTPSFSPVAGGALTARVIRPGSLR